MNRHRGLRGRPLPPSAMRVRDDAGEPPEPVPMLALVSPAADPALVAADRLRHKAEAGARAAEQAVRTRRDAPAPDGTPAGLPAVGDRDHAPAPANPAVPPPVPPDPISVPPDAPEPATAVVRPVTTPDAGEVRRLAAETRLGWAPDGASAWIEPRVEHRPRFDGSPADAAARAEAAAARRRDVARAEVKAATEREVARAEWMKTLAEAVAKFEPDFDVPVVAVAKKARGHGPSVSVSRFKFKFPNLRSR